MIFSGNTTHRDLVVSLGLLGFIIAQAVSQLALYGYWQKVLRVTLAFVTYSAALLSLAQYSKAVDSSCLPFRMFAIAGGAAEVASGWLRPDWRISDTLILPLAAGVLIGGLHWVALIAWRPLRQRILSGGT